MALTNLITLFERASERAQSIIRVYADSRGAHAQLKQLRFNHIENENYVTFSFSIVLITGSFGSYTSS